MYKFKETAATEKEKCVCMLTVPIQRLITKLVLGCAHVFEITAFAEAVEYYKESGCFL